jgi:hypothetical protein
MMNMKYEPDIKFSEPEILDVREECFQIQFSVLHEWTGKDKALYP